MVEKLKIEKNNLIDLLRRYNKITWDELKHHFVSSKKTTDYVIEKYNLLLCKDINVELAEFIKQMHDEKYVIFERCDAIEYMLNGTIPEDVDVAKQIPIEGYKNDIKWLPTLIAMRR